MGILIRHMQLTIVPGFLWDFTKNHYLLVVLSQLAIQIFDDMLYLKAEAMLPLIQLS